MNPGVLKSLALVMTTAMTLPAGVRTGAQFPGPPGPMPGRGPATGTGIIVGQTVDGTTGRPIAGALVSLSVTPGNLESFGPSDAIPMDQLMSLDFGSLFAGVHQAITDAQGRFAFTALPKGTFSLAAMKPGWMGGGFGQRHPDGTPTPLKLSDAEHAGNVILQLWKNAALGGVVLDEAGEPIVGLTVRTLRRTWLAGRPRYTLGAAGQTDDRGVYRISSLRPGEYVAVITQTPVTTPASGSVPALDPAVLQSMIASNGPGTDPNALMASISTLASSGSSGGIRVGDWVLQTSSIGSRLVPPVVTADGRMFAYRTTFYPTASLASQAASIALGSGEERSGVDFQLRAGPVVRVSGTVTGSEGPLANTSVRLLPTGTEDLSSESGFESATATTNASGLFTFLAVPPGQYTLKILRTPRRPTPSPAAAANLGMSMIQNASGGMTTSMGSFGMDTIMPVPPPIPSEPTLWASLSLGVGDTDLTGLTVPLKTGFRISGRAEFSGTAAKPTSDQLRRIPISLDRADTGGVAPSPFAGLGQSQNGQFDSNGQFTTYGLVPGRYFIRVPFSIAGWTLKSATLGGKDLADSPLEIDNSDASGVVLTFTDRATELSGVARDAQGQPDSDASVLVFPTSPEGWVDFGSAPRRLRVARTNKDGQFRIAGLPPGDYFAAAIRGDVAGEWQNPTFLQGLVRMAIKITINDGEKRAQDLRTVR